MRDIYVEPIKRRFAILVPPKCGTSAIADWLYRCGTGEEFFGDGPPHEFVEKEWHGEKKEVDGLDAHEWMDSKSCLPMDQVQHLAIPVIAIHRDPLARFFSAYNHFVLTCLLYDEGIPSRRVTPTPEQFLADLPHWRGEKEKITQHLRKGHQLEISHDKAVEWHTDPQTLFLGDEQLEFHAAFPNRKLKDLPDFVGKIIGDDGLPPMRRTNQTRQRVQDGLDSDRIVRLSHAVEQYYLTDYEAGWDGETFAVYR